MAAILFTIDPPDLCVDGYAITVVSWHTLLTT